MFLGFLRDISERKDLQCRVQPARALPVIFVTAYADPAMRNRVAAAIPGAQLLRKPVDEAALLRAVMRALAN